MATGDRSVTFSGTSAEDVDIPSSTVVIEEDEDPSGLETNPTHNSAVLSWRFPYRSRTSVVEYRLSANGGSFGAWTEIPQSRLYQSHGSRYEVPNLALSTEYAFKLRYKSDHSTGPEVEAGATTFEPFTALFTDLPAFRDTRSTARSDQLFTVTGEYSNALRTSRALGPRHGLVEVDGAVYVGRDDGRDPDSFWMELRAMANTTSVAITLKAPDGPKVRCTEAEANSAPIRKICSADLRPLSEDVTGIVRARREVRLALDTESISENGGVANLTARLYKPRSRDTDPVNETSDVDVYVDVQITDEAGDVEASGTRLTIPAGSRDSNAIALSARDNGEATGNRRIAIAAATASEGHVALDSETGRVELEIEEDDRGFLAPDDFEATPGPEAVRLSWDASVNAGAHTYQYRYWGTGTAPDWQDVPDSGVGGANHSGFLVSGLAKQTAYTFEVRARAGTDIVSVARSVDVTTLSEYTVELEDPPTHFRPGEAFEVTVVFSADLLRFEGQHHEHTSQVVVQGGTYERLARAGQGQGRAWNLTIRPDSGATEVTVGVNAEQPPQLRCAPDETARICSSALHPLTQGASVTVPVYGAPAFDTGLPGSVGVAENTAADTDIGSPFTATDNDLLTWTLDGTDMESFAVDSDTGQLKTRAALDYEARSSYSVTVGVSDGTSSDTHAVSVGVTDVDEQPATPAAPDVTATPGATTSLTVRWTAPDANGGPAIAGYNLQYRQDASGNFTDGPRNVTETTAAITGLSADTGYQVRVRALNGETPSEWSEPGAGATATAAAPYVTGIAITPDDPGALEWIANETFEVHVTFNEPVAVTITDLIPVIKLTVKGHTALVGYTSGSGSDTLVFAWVALARTLYFSEVAIAANSMASNGVDIVSQASGIAADLRHDAMEPTAAPGAGEPSAQPDPLTAEFLDLPEDGHGGNEFTFRLRFSEEFPLSYLTLLESAFQVSNGTVSAVARATPGNDRAWDITVTPAGAGAVTVTLPRTTDCDADGAICAGDGRKLSALVEETVPETVEAVQAAVQEAVPLRVRLVGFPGEHAGTGEIVFTVEFTKEPGADYSYTTLRGSTLNIRRGGQTRLTPEVRRLNPPHNDRWEVRVAPGSEEDVTVSIGPFSLCTDTGAVCTGDGEVLANRVSETILGPRGLSVADARVNEAEEGATLDFAVTLARASPETVSVGYATADGTATADEDYEPDSGALTFLMGETSKTVAVAVLDDGHDEGEQTLTLRLSNAAGGNAYLADAEATGTIVNSDPMPKAWLARFGRTASVQTVDAIRERLAGGPRRSADNHFTVGGQRVDQLFDDFRNAARGADAKETGDRAAPDRRLEDESAWERMDRLKAESMGWGTAPGGTGLSGGGIGLAGGESAGGTPRMGGPAPTGLSPSGSNDAGLPSAGLSPAAPPSTGVPSAGLLSEARAGLENLVSAGLSSAGLPFAGLLSTARPFADLLSRGRDDWRALLMGSSFDYSRTLEDGTGTANGLASWSAWGRAAETRFSGADGKLSINGEVATATVGADAQWGRWLAGVAVSHSFGEGAYTHASAGGGELTSRLTSVNPYANFDVNERLSLWGAVGYGVGDLALRSERADDTIETGLESTLAAFGGRGVFSRRAGGLKLAVVSDALFTNTVSEAAMGLMGAEGASSRVRLMLEGSGSMLLPNGAVLRPTLEAGLRYDGGDAETGAGVEIGGGLAFSARRLSVELNVRGLLAHEDAEYEEWGFSGSLKWQPNEDGSGWAMEAGSSWGDTASGVNALWSRQDASGLARAAGMDAARRFHAEFGYGLEGRRGRALWVPFFATESSAGQQAYRMGLKLTSGPNLEAGLELGRRTGARGVAEAAIQLQGSMRW